MLVMRESSAFVLTLALAALAGCGGGTSPKDTPQEATEAPPERVEQVEAEDLRSSKAAASQNTEIDMTPITASGPSDAIRQINARDETRRLMNMQTGQRTPELPLDVSWPYGECSDAASLIPPPRDGWRLFALNPGSWSQDANMARITYSSLDESLEPGTAEYNASKQDVSIYISSGTMDVQAMKDLYTNPQLAGVMLEPGPYNYPVRKMPTDFPGRGVLLGDYFVQLNGRGAEMEAYFSTIMKCAIDNGLIAEGVDTSTLTETP